MSYSTRKKYKSRREKFNRIKRNTRLILIFGSIAAVVLLFKNRWYIYDWFRTLFY